jgi:hypothetical protein
MTHENIYIMILIIDDTLIRCFVGFEVHWRKVKTLFIVHDKPSKIKLNFSRNICLHLLTEPIICFGL